MWNPDGAVPMDQVEDVVAVGDEAASFRARALARYDVVFRMKGGAQVSAFRARLSHRDAFAIANAASELLSDEEPIAG